jgi:hypothetical protein
MEYRVLGSVHQNFIRVGVLQTLVYLKLKSNQTVFSETFHRKIIRTLHKILWRVWVLETPFGLLLRFINNFTSLHVNYFYNETRTSPSVKNTVFWDVAPCGHFVNRRFGGTYRLHLQGRCHRSWMAFTRKMEAIRSSETSVDKIPTVRHIPEDGLLHSHRRENLKFHIVRLCSHLPRWLRIASIASSHCFCSFLLNVKISPLIVELRGLVREHLVQGFSFVLNSALASVASGSNNSVSGRCIGNANWTVA